MKQTPLGNRTTKMQFKTFALPVGGNETIENELNLFLRSHRVVQVERHLETAIAGKESQWLFLIEWVEGEVKYSDSAPVNRNRRPSPTEDMTTAEAAGVTVRNCAVSMPLIARG